MIPEEFVGKKFRQHGPELRWTLGGNASDQVTSSRAVDGHGNFTDDPPIIEFAANADANIPFLLKIGAIELYTGRAQPTKTNLEHVTVATPPDERQPDPLFADADV